MNEDQVFSIVGEAGFTRLIASFYRQVVDDDILGPMYPKEDREGAEQRLRDFLIYRFGGSQRLLRNAGIRVCECGILDSESTRPPATSGCGLWAMHFSEAALPTEAEQFLRTFLEQMSTFMINDGGFEA